MHADGDSRHDPIPRPRGRAVKYTIRAGYDPEGLVRFFEMLQRRGDRGGGGLATYFRTHPPTGDRIERVEKEIRRYERD